MLGRAFDMDTRGPVGYAMPDYIHQVIQDLEENSPYAALDRLADEERAAQAKSAAESA